MNVRGKALFEATKQQLNNSKMVKNEMQATYLLWVVV